MLYQCKFFAMSLLLKQNKIKLPDGDIIRYLILLILSLLYQG